MPLALTFSSLDRLKAATCIREEQAAAKVWKATKKDRGECCDTL